MPQSTYNRKEIIAKYERKNALKFREANSSLHSERSSTSSAAFDGETDSDNLHSDVYDLMRSMELPP